ncbi:acetyl-CoA carboxylase biotin carboxylase subunit [candidate division KSB1 bacterium]|nr:acetyl-CoA carboxylase biotin carboxylase subunit [candidate division KSB1 bacterium]
MIKKLLIANRGEIAVRIARTAREMGIATVGIYSDADRSALHVQSVDEAHDIGASPAAESYLRQEKILEAAGKSGADAIHPGYGFHSEKADFAQRVTDAGLIWVGPPPRAIDSMGSKTGARELMTKAGVPVVPGSDGPVASADDAKAFANRVGYPVLLKAVSGGGGKGMRVVERADDMKSAYEAAQREALAAFADGSVYVEKYLKNPRHIEIQVFADQHGNVVYLGERECTLQRRHQKIIEESPSAVVTPELRAKMGATAVAAAKACGYVNAGTIETLLDADGRFYFLEMNTRLQVEHPVTEEVTGYDLVRLQLMVAAGEKLPFTQEQITRRGHAIEVRIYAEDVANGFLPSTGKLTRLRGPNGPGIREDSGMREGDEVSRFYDPMISKLIARAESRPAAIERMLRALEAYEVVGVRTNISFCRHILATERFAKADFSTHSADHEFLDSYRAELNEALDDEAVLAAAIAHVALNAERAPHVQLAAPGAASGNNGSNWTRSGRLAALRK